MALPWVAAEPKLLTDPGVQEVKDLAENGQDQAEQGAATAQSEAGQLQKKAETAGERALESARSLQSSVIVFLEAAQEVAWRATGPVVCFAFPCQPDADTDENHYGLRGMSSQSSTILPVDSGPVAGIAMVVAAGAVGGALLWLTVLQRGVVFGAVPLLSRIAHSEIYTNDARRLIAQIASENPGLCLNEIVSRTGYSRNAVSYHLFVLEKEEELVSIKDGKYRRYFPRGGKYVNGAKQVVSVLRNETTLKMAQHIVSNPGTIQRDICQVLGTTASAACWHAKRLEQLGVIRKERVANTVQYFPGDELGRHDYSEFGLLGAAVAPAAP